MEAAGSLPSPHGSASPSGFRQVPSNSDVEAGAGGEQKVCLVRSRLMAASALACLALVLAFAAHRSGVLRGAAVTNEAVGLSDSDHNMLQVHAFGPYRFNYDGPLKIEGSMKVKSAGDGEGASQILDYDLKGTDPECGTKDVTGIANACGIHIHVGISCAEDAGGHYFSVASDPWKSVTYVTKGGVAKAEGIAVVTGLSGQQVFNHVVIIHDSSGAKAGCGSLMEFMEGQETSDFDCTAGLNNAEAGWSSAKKKWCCAEKSVGCELSAGASSDFLVPSFVPYYNYQGDLKVAGVIRVTSTDSAQTLAWRLSGMDSECGSKDITGIKGACGVHIHVGTDCAASAGGHYFKGDDDPWGSVHYTTADGASQNSGGLTVASGYSSSEVRGHTMIVHDSSGAKIACGILKAAALVPSFTAYFNYPGTLQVTGTVVVATSGEGEDAAHAVEWRLKGTDQACRSKDLSGVPNACGVHIHVGTSCSEEAGGHFFAGEKDPWASVHYVTAEDGSSSMGETVVTGLDAGKIAGHAFIVHDSTGAKVACGIIGA